MFDEKRNEMLFMVNDCFMLKGQSLKDLYFRDRFSVIPNKIIGVYRKYLSDYNIQSTPFTLLGKNYFEPKYFDYLLKSIKTIDQEHIYSDGDKRQYPIEGIELPIVTSTKFLQ